MPRRLFPFQYIRLTLLDACAVRRALDVRGRFDSVWAKMGRKYGFEAFRATFNAVEGVAMIPKLFASRQVEFLKRKG